MGNKQAKTISGKDARLFDINARGADIYPQALKEKKSETRAELFRHAGLCFCDEKAYMDAARSFTLSGEAFTEVPDCTMEASEAYQSAFRSWALCGTAHIDDFKQCIELALEYSQDSKYPKLEAGCRDQIAQSICVMLEEITSLSQLQRFLRHQLFFQYVYGDLFNNGLAMLLLKMRQFKLPDMNVWARVCKAGMQYYIQQFELDGRYNEHIATLASAALLAAYLARLQPEDEKLIPGVKSPTTATSSRRGTVSKVSKTSQTTAGGSGGSVDVTGGAGVLVGTENATSPAVASRKQSVTESQRSATHTPPQFCNGYNDRVNFSFWFRNIGRDVPSWTVTMRQAVWNVTSAADCGDIDSIDNNFHYMTTTLRKDMFKVLPYLSTIYRERFEVYVAKAFIMQGEWIEEEHVLDENGVEINAVTNQQDEVDDDDIDFLK